MKKAATVPRRRMPAEWEPHEATWIAWPHYEPDWPGKLEPIGWVYAEIVRAIGLHERVEVLCHDEAVRDKASMAIQAHGVPEESYRLHVVPTDRVWVRDYGPTGVIGPDGKVEWVNWKFNAWAKYGDYRRDELVGAAMERITGVPRIVPEIDGRMPVLEGGAIDCDGAGSLLVTEECFLSDVQIRNPGLDRDGYERVFSDFLGVNRTIWLGDGCVGDDTHGHVDDIARFVAPGVVVLAFERDPADENHRRSVDNLRRLELAPGPRLNIIQLPYPRAVMMTGIRLPASYANFYIANGVVVVPTFNDRNDRTALNVLAECFPDREVVGIHAVDLVWGLGTLHCLTQQQPAKHR